MFIVSVFYAMFSKINVIDVTAIKILTKLYFTNDIIVFKKKTSHSIYFEKDRGKWRIILSLRLSVI